jgi:hypothetical protein
MKYILVTILSLLSSTVFAGSCIEIAKYDELNSQIIVVCPNLYKFNNEKASKTVRKIFSSRKFVPDEYEIYFVVSKDNLVVKDLTPNELVGWYYTHDNQLTIWPEIPNKKKIMQLSNK